MSRRTSTRLAGALALIALAAPTAGPAEPTDVQSRLMVPAPGREPVTFAVHAPDAADVTLEFTGNYWNRRPEDRIALAPTGEDEPSHAVTLHLGDGQWLYRFRVDGRWRHDASNPRSAGAENGQRNSVLFVGERPAPDPDVTRGRLVETTLPSAALGRDQPIVVYRPPTIAGDTASLPVLLLLHGFGQPASDWSATIEVHRAMERLLAAGDIVPFVLAMPSGENGFWLGAHERHVLDEVLPWLEREHDVLVAPTTAAIAGFSAGGHGALHLGWLAQNRLGLVMPIAMAARCAGNVCREEDFARLYPGETDLEFALWVGANDELGLQRNHDAFSARLDALGVAHTDTRSRSDGHLEDGHSVRYVRTVVDDVLRRASRHFEGR